ncbi:MAG: hypothetical protein GX568_00210 [Candidatus Gastranaerophilales bacterium]|jgi:hypothetical protein|nr:hypothetical protein [Candidatus Gastranaerophilales bacterium]
MKTGFLNTVKVALTSGLISISSCSKPAQKVIAQNPPQEAVAVAKILKDRRPDTSGLTLFYRDTVEIPKKVLKERAENPGLIIEATDALSPKLRKFIYKQTNKITDKIPQKAAGYTEKIARFSTGLEYKYPKFDYIKKIQDGSVKPYVRDEIFTTNGKKALLPIDWYGKKTEGYDTIPQVNIDSINALY